MKPVRQRGGKYVKEAVSGLTAPGDGSVLDMKLAVLPPVEGSSERAGLLQAVGGALFMKRSAIVPFVSFNLPDGSILRPRVVGRVKRATSFAPQLNSVQVPIADAHAAMQGFMPQAATGGPVAGAGIPHTGLDQPMPVPGAGLRP